MTDNNQNGWITDMLMGFDGPQLKESNAVPTCASFSTNTVYIKEACPYFPTQAK